MPLNTLSEILAASTLVVHPGRFAMVKLRGGDRRAYQGDYFAMMVDADEVTAVLEERYVEDAEFTHAEQWFKLIELKVAVPFYATGFLASVTNAVASRGLNVLVISTFSKDYLLIREEAVDVAVAALVAIGLREAG